MQSTRKKTRSAKKSGTKTQMPPVNSSHVDGDGVQDDDGFGDTPGADGSGSTGVISHGGV